MKTPLERLRAQTYVDEHGHWFMQKKATQVSLHGKLTTVRHFAYYVRHNALPPPHHIVRCSGRVGNCVRPSHMIALDSMLGRDFTDRQKNRVRQRALRYWRRRCRACGNPLPSRWAKRTKTLIAAGQVWCSTCLSAEIRHWTAEAKQFELEGKSAMPRVIYWNLIRDPDESLWETDRLLMPTRNECVTLAITQEYGKAPLPSDEYLQTEHQRTRKVQRDRRKAKARPPADKPAWWTHLVNGERRIDWHEITDARLPRCAKQLALSRDVLFRLTPEEDDDGSWIRRR